MPVERAFEANELATKKQKQQQKDPTTSNQRSSNEFITEAEPCEFLGKPRSSSTCQPLDGSKQDVERMRKSRYEIPDNQLSRKAVTILAGKKEVEMLELYGTDEDSSECDERKLVLVPNVDPSGDRDSPENR